MLQAQDIRPPRAPQNRLATIAIVAAIHVVVVSAFLLGLRPAVFEHFGDKPIITHYIVERPTNNTPPKVPIVNLLQPKIATPKVPEPVVKIDEGQSQGPITVTPASPQQPGLVVARTFPAQAIPGTHTIPEYPPIDTRLGHEGNVMLRLSINEMGMVVDAQILRSSGFESLDQAAANWVKAHWRYRPASQGGDAVASTADITVTFRLTNR